MNESFDVENSHPANSVEQIIYRHRPTRHCGFGFCDLPASIDYCVFRIGESIDFENLVAEQIHVPNNKSSSRKVVTSFTGQLAFRRRPVVALASDLDGKRWSAAQKLHARSRRCTRLHRD